QPRATLALAEAQLASARKAAAEDQARLQQAEVTLQRRAALVKENVVGKAELDEAQSEVDSLKARIAYTQQQIGVAEQQVNLQKTMLADMVVRAPFSGVAISKDAQPGEMISPVSAGGGFTRTGIGTIVDMDSLEIQVDVNESFINRVTPGQPVEAMLNAYPDWKIPASVIAIIPAADRAKATVKVRIAIKARDARLVPDMGVRVAFLDNERKGPAGPVGGVVVPAEAVRGEGSAAVVFVYADGKVERRAVTLARAAGASRHVLTGVREGERVVLSPPESLKGGESVRLADKT